MAIIKIVHVEGPTCLFPIGTSFSPLVSSFLHSAVGLFKGFVIKTKHFGATGGLRGDFGYKFLELSDFDPNLRNSKLFIGDFESELFKFGLPNGLCTGFGGKLGDLGLKFGDCKELLGDLGSLKASQGFCS